MKAKKGNPHKKEYMNARKEAYRKAKLRGRVAEAKFLEGNSRKEAEEKFDKATKHDELLGRSSNPYRKYKKGGKVFKPHNMYKDGKAVMAKTMADHLRLKKQGYTHKK